MLKSVGWSTSSTVRYVRQFRYFHVEPSIALGHPDAIQNNVDIKEPGTMPVASTSREHVDLLRRLVEVLNKSRAAAPPAFTWKLFLDVVNSWSIPKDSITLPIYQRALRRCLPYAFAVRGHAWKKTPKWKRASVLSALHPHSDKIRVILESSRASGVKLQAEDYNFILSHYAAVGNAQGALDVIQEMRNSGLSPNETSFVRVLQALSRKLHSVDTLPREEKEEMYHLAAQSCRGIMSTMKQCGFPSAPVLDLVTRILGTTGSLETYEELLKSVYGVDLAQPDTVPTDFLHQFQYSVEDARRTNHPIPSLPSISTQTLNTVIKLTGEHGVRAAIPAVRNQSYTKMIAAFECLTAPLPSMRNPDEAFGYDVGDDDEPYVPTLTFPDGTIFPGRLSTPAPNSQTFDFLLTYLCQADYKILAKHYLKVTYEQERTQSRSFRETIGKLLHPFRTENPKPLTESDFATLVQQHVLSPRIQTNRHMFKVMVHMAKRKGDLQMLMWILNLERSSVIHKEQSLKALVKMATWIKDSGKMFGTTNSGLGVAEPGSSPLIHAADKHIRSLRRNIVALTEHLESLGHSMVVTIPSPATKTDGSAVRKVWMIERRRKRKKVKKRRSPAPAPAPVPHTVLLETKSSKNR
ncbi:uncharacterized protein EI90DRAFT_3031798 [Cantharellus anzutake]|uniref:uncharacterized protein n=1 Tax=Cantharellus anzutake TaxID=1750568 RepID=UPI001904506B|nr:uncharacterized protein EI90DRAFT_3031798 [Cantharellus anzutake]KAF8341997.1 hypothetical protein EI90DRAFT_3031798 [Cantharellus anzutake]